MSRQRNPGTLALFPNVIKATAVSMTGAHPETELLPPAVARLLRGFVAGLAVLLLLAAGALLTVEQRYDGRIYPSVMAGGIDLGGKSLDDARSLLQSDADARQTQVVTFTYGGKTWTPTLAELGIAIDVERTLDGAYDVGREETARTRISNLTGLLRNDRQVPLSVTVDQAVLNGWFDAVDADLGLTPHDAYLRIDGSEVTIEPEVEGTVVDRGKATEIVMQGAQALYIPDGDLPVTATVAKVRAGDLADAQASLALALSKPVKLKYGKDRWTLQPEDLSGFVTQSVDPAKRGADAFSVTIDEKQLAGWLSEQLSSEVNRDPVNAKVAWSEKKQAPIAVEESQEGAKLKPLTLARAVIDSFWNDHQTVEVPVTIVKPSIDSNNLDALGITTRIAVGDSSYVGSNDGRATNIVVGSQLLNGALIPPHGEFSFNHAIGVIEESRGYVEASVISGERIGRDVGGGICQVSTTVFRAAMRAGVPITEWWPHTYRLGFYEHDGWPPGYDASILQPDGDPFSGGDFKFQNPTDSWMLVESYTENERVYVILYGPDLGYDVEFTEPWISDPIPPPDDDIEVIDYELPAGSIEQSEYEQTGVQVVFERIVKDQNGEVIRQDTWDTVFASRPDVWKVSPDMEGKSPASG
ncbi:MAG: VanW family protein [Thermomicrobiales bacterium]|nr:VanW family protein [Thermomicrobiales bacterium]